MEYLGKILDINDPLHKGRCKILVYGIFGTTKLEDIPVDDLPWAYPEVPITFGNKGGGQIPSTILSILLLKNLQRIW